MKQLLEDQYFVAHLPKVGASIAPPAQAELFCVESVGRGFASPRPVRATAALHNAAMLLESPHFEDIPWPTYEEGGFAPWAAVARPREKAARRRKPLALARDADGEQSSKLANAGVYGHGVWRGNNAYGNAYVHGAH